MRGYKGMSILLIYILVIIAFAIATFANLSRGAFFKETVKAIILIIAILLTITMCILATIWYSWLHIIGLLGTALVSAWVFGFIWKTTIFKHIP